ncbi:hypothetical protein GGR56DRAFT_623080 [Xylariaceae sp. FL0804]|nr:hypothetical protein GGR56DRAFT_623080 [Xylariaceae sp. FL0804]
MMAENNSENEDLMNENEDLENEYDNLRNENKNLRNEIKDLKNTQSHEELAVGIAMIFIMVVMILDATSFFLGARPGTLWAPPLCADCFITAFAIIICFLAQYVILRATPPGKRWGTALRSLGIGSLYRRWPNIFLPAPAPASATGAWYEFSPDGHRRLV